MNTVAREILSPLNLRICSTSCRLNVSTGPSQEDNKKYVFLHRLQWHLFRPLFSVIVVGHLLLRKLSSSMHPNPSLNKQAFLVQVRLSRHQLSSHAIGNPAERHETISPNLQSAHFCCV